ncbi:uncharacterized protein AB675_6929 [Cyphellophora attinorum]|uniref:Uncharacterized protein n=1 Tax=Cyphellophora attinorum TaxID=1664694 RepID=A0A0N1HDS2_9EURO|nr:uncharacterized protein AB675_6929 [Phialophora attinorum]KPI43263.1 hypothetical protein AB675_6929 [Phialophora attinorum]
MGNVLCSWKKLECRKRSLAAEINPTLSKRTKGFGEALVSQPSPSATFGLGGPPQPKDAPQQSSFVQFGNNKLPMSLAIVALVCSVLVLFALIGATIYCCCASRRKIRARKAARKARADARNNTPYSDNVEMGNYSKLSQIDRAPFFHRNLDKFDAADVELCTGIGVPRQE